MDHVVPDDAHIPPESFDVIAADLQALRATAGHPSYAEIAQRIGRAREMRGIDAAISQPGRTTVYDAFRAGRARINPELVSEIVCALGATPEEAEQWAARCRAARALREAGDHSRDARRREVEEASEASPTTAPTVAAPTAAESTAAESTGTETPPEKHPVAYAAPDETRRPAPWFVVIVLITCLAINQTGHVVVGMLNLPLYLDMVGTAITAIMLGPWVGAALGATSSVIGAATVQPDLLLFIPVQVAGALVWGFGIRSFHMGRTLGRFFVLNLIAGFACTAIAAPIILFVLGGYGGHQTDSLTETILDLSASLSTAVFSSNLLTSFSDKLIAGFIALAVVSATRRWHSSPLTPELPFTSEPPRTIR